MTNDLSQLSCYQPSQGSDQITIGDGNSIPIQHTGKCLLPTPHHLFKLNNVLHADSLSSNLIPIRKLAQDNNCIISFDDTHFVIQNKVTKRILHKGSNLHGLYHFFSTTTSPALAPHSAATHTSFTSQVHSSSSSAVSTIWNNRLGHPKKQFSTSLQIFRTNGGTELFNNKMKQFTVSQVDTSCSTTDLSQKKYAQDILLKAGMMDYKACSSPIFVNPGLPPNSNEPFANPSVYKSIVGALQCLTITRPDISFAVNQLCQHMHNPTVSHYAGVKRLLRFIKGTISHGLTYTPSSFGLHAYSDSNWAGDSLKNKPLSLDSLLKQSTDL
ncbi:hypothetical protein CsSME_00020835 [Camellia sinensis var. sinensis]